MELIGFPEMYRIIYSFHMPAFIFLTGYFATYSRKEIIYFAAVYIIFQILYIVFNTTILEAVLY